MEKLIIIKTLAELKDLESYLEYKDFVAVDTETTGVERGDQVIGVSISAESDVGYYIILLDWSVEKQTLRRLETTVGIDKFLKSLQSKSLVMHNAVFDCSMILDNFNIDLMPSIHTDTMLLGHLLNENRSNGLKERGVELFGEDARQEQIEMKASVERNGGTLTKKAYELYKADAELIAKYGAKDAILTLKLFHNDLPILCEEGLDKFFYEEETMPLLRGPTYEMNREGLKVDPEKLQNLKGELETECLEAYTFIHKEILEYIKDKYPATGKTNKFNIDSGSQRGWLLFVKLQNPFYTLTKGGKELCKSFGMKLPYTLADKREFIRICESRKGTIWCQGKWDPKKKKKMAPKKVRDYWNYLACGKESLQKLSIKYKWVARLLEYSENKKLLNTYVEGIQSRMKYGIIRPNFLQHGTTSGRYSCKNPNFQNLPRNDKRIKACIVARPEKVLVGADYSQLEPRVFASVSQDKALLNSFESGDDFYSTIGMNIFDKYDCSARKEDEDSFASKYPKLRDIAKVVALSSTYGTTAPKMAPTIGKSMDEAQEIIDNYFERFPGVYKFMLDTHHEIKTNGKVYNLYGRPRRIEKALEINEIYGNRQHTNLPYEARTLLNLSVNHKTQSTAASIMNRAAIAFLYLRDEMIKIDERWGTVRIVLQVHDEFVVECAASIAEDVKIGLKESMEKTTLLPGVDLVAEPKIGNNLAELK